MRASLSSDPGFDAVDVVAEVDAIGDGLDMEVFGDEVLFEEGEGGLAGGGGEADEEGIEVVEDLPPEVACSSETPGRSGGHCHQRSLGDSHQSDFPLFQDTGGS